MKNFLTALHWKQTRSLFVTGWLSVAAAAFLHAVPDTDSSDIVEQDTRASLEPLLSQHCYDCHDDLTDKGGLNLLDLDFNPDSQENFDLWKRVFERVEIGEMPPKKEPRPDEKLKEEFLHFVETPLLAADLARKKVLGRTQVRRLTRQEYENTMHDLLGIGLPLDELLPEDQETHGFETVAAGQQFSHHNLERYLEVADEALVYAFRRATGPQEKFKNEVSAWDLGKGGHNGGNYRGPQNLEEKAVFWPMRLPFYGRMPKTQVRAAGWYDITLHDVTAVNPPETGVVWGSLRSGVTQSSAPILHMVGLVPATEEKRDMTYRAWIRSNDMLELRPNDLSRPKSESGARGGSVAYKKGRSLEKEDREGFSVSSITVERVFPMGDKDKVQWNLFGTGSDEKVAALLDNKQKWGTLQEAAIQRFANRAFRRPVSKKTLAPYLDLAKAEAAESKNIADGLRVAYRAILCSPRFLTFIESTGKLDDHALASRLSYMIWNSMPDAELRKLADQGKLSDGKVRHAQLNRLLDDPKSERFIESFTDQWLRLKEIDFTTPDPRRFKNFDPIVQESMLQETRSFVGKLIRENKDVRNLVQSDFAMLNERLARYYRLEAEGLAPGKGIQKVPLDSPSRGGLVTQGAILKVTADGSSTSPILRGVFVSERILGVEIPPPPPGIPAVEPDIRGAVSIRDQIEKHRSSEDCSACHAVIDPPGFALEIFDPAGLYRTFYGKTEKSAHVDPSGVTPEGDAFEGIAGWKRSYLKRPEMLSKGFAKQLLVYASGASLRFSDRAAMDRIVEHASSKGHGMRSILHGVIASEIFRYK